MIGTWLLILGEVTLLELVLVDWAGAVWYMVLARETLQKLRTEMMSFEFTLSLCSEFSIYWDSYKKRIFALKVQIYEIYSWV